MLETMHLVLEQNANQNNDKSVVLMFFFCMITDFDRIRGLLKIVAVLFEAKNQSFPEEVLYWWKLEKANGKGENIF